LLLRGLWWRRGLTIAVLTVASVTAAAATLGPLYARAAGESTLRDELTNPGDADPGLHLAAVSGPQQPNVELSHFPALVSAAPPAGSVRGYPTQVGSIYVPTSGAASPVSAVKTALVWRTGACAHMIIVAGHCPTAAGQALVSQRTAAAKAYGWAIGKTLTMGLGPPLTIVGTYTPRDLGDPFWPGATYFNAGPNPQDQPDTVDAVFVDQAAFAAVPGSTLVQLALDYPLDPAQIRLDDIPGLRRQVAALEARYTPAQGLEMTSGVDTVLNAAAHQRNLVDTGTLLVTLQLGLLAWLVLFQVVAEAVESRGNEIALAKLRGHRPGRTVRFALGEPLVLIIAALPIGLLLAWIAAHLFAATVLAPHTPVVLTWWAFAALGAAFAGGLVAAALAARRTLTRTVLQQWRRTRSRNHVSAGLIVVDVLVALGAIGGLIALRAQDRDAGSSTAALLAPGLLVVAVALLGTRALPLLARLLLAPTRRSGRIGLFLASRQVVRRPAALRMVALLAIAVGLATFAVGGESVASANRNARAEAEVGAAQVVRVQYSPDVDPIAAVRQADPDGRWAMAAATWLPDGDGSVLGRVLALDSTRLAAVGYAAAGGPSTASLAATLGASSRPSVRYTGTALRVQLDASAITGPSPEVQIMLRTARKAYYPVTAGRLLPGRHTYSAAADCAQGCTVVGLVWNRPYGAIDPMRGTIVVNGGQGRSGQDWRDLDLGLTAAGAWRPGPQFGSGSDVLQATPAGLRDDYTSAAGGYGGATYAFAPSPLPAVATRPAISGAPPTGPVTGPPAGAHQLIDGLAATAPFTVRQWAEVLPVVLDDGVMFDASFLDAELPAFASEAAWSVWLGPHAPSDASQRLTAAGLTLGGVTRTHSRVVLLGRQGPALSLILLLACAIVGSVVSIGGTAISIAASSRRRSFEMAALRVVGVGSAALYRAALLEQLMLLGTAVVLGVPSGVLAAWLAMPAIPEFSDSTPVMLQYAPDAVPIVAFAAVFCLLVLLTAAGASQLVARAARPGRLREAEE
jgi:hypothetical protein